MNKFFLLLIALSTLLFAKQVSADHDNVRCGGNGEQACIVLISPLVENVIKQHKELTWCLNARASTYPGFRAQVEASMINYAEELKLPQRQVPYPASEASLACLIRHDMPDVHACKGCAAWVYVSNYPVVIEYRWQVGYTYWFSTIGHELGHAICLLDEHYDKENFRSWRMTYGYWIHGEPTVMDVGTHALPEYSPYGVWLLTPYDVSRCYETLNQQDPDLVIPLPEWGESHNNGLDWWTYNNWDGLWHMTRWLADGRTEEYRSTGGPWYCVEGCP